MSNWRIFRDYGLTILVAALFALLIRGFVLEAYRIPNSTMSPTLLPGETIFSAKWPLWLDPHHFPDRGDVVIFAETISLTPQKGSSDEEHAAHSSPTHFVRRVIGLPGDEVSVKKGLVTLNGKQLALPGSFDSGCFTEVSPSGKKYRACTQSSDLPDDLQIQKVPERHFFVLGDSRSSNKKSKFKVPHFIPNSAVRAKALWIWLSIDDSNQNRWLPEFRLQRMFRRIE